MEADYRSHEERVAEWKKEQEERDAKERSVNQEAERIRGMSGAARKAERSKIIVEIYNPAFERFKEIEKELKAINKKQKELRKEKKELDSLLREKAINVDMLECPERRERIFCHLSGDRHAICVFKTSDTDFKCPRGFKVGDPMFEEKLSK